MRTSTWIRRPFNCLDLRSLSQHYQLSTMPKITPRDLHQGFYGIFPHPFTVALLILNYQPKRDKLYKRVKKHLVITLASTIILPCIYLPINTDNYCTNRTFVQFSLSIKTTWSFAHCFFSYNFRQSLIDLNPDLSCFFNVWNLTYRVQIKEV